MSEEKKNENITEGGISVEAEHIFPVIKKWLYSEKDIFLREIISNAADAITKLRRLISLGEARVEDETWRIDIKLDKEKGTVTVSDTGIGMSPEEIRKYICNIALSGAVDFISKYEDNDAGAGIIGHFGLGFYSSFMVCDKVEVLSRSYTEEKASLWSGNEDGSYVIKDGMERATHGTDVIMYISEEEKEYLDSGRIRSIIDKYCAFMNVPIFFDDGEAKEKKEKDKTEGKEEEEEERPVNDPNPLWLKNPSECTDEEYTDFYRKVFGDYREPLFHIHINADYPLNFKGIIYFPKLNLHTDNIEGQIKLYYNQVFVSDNVKDILPEYMLMLRGVIDCPELPLNVSRSYMQNDAYVRKMSNHIVKKVCDKINNMFINDRDNYEKLWKDVKLFIEYSSIRDSKFFEKISSSLLLEKTDGSFCTIDEYLEGAKEKHDKTVYYVNDKVAGAQYIEMYTSEGIEVVLMDNALDAQFIPMVEQNKDIKFKRVDSDVADALTEGEGEESETVANLFKEIGGEKLTVKFENLKNADIPAVLNINEENRRFEDMMKMYSMGQAPAMPPVEATLIVNSSNPLIKYLESNNDKEVAGQIYNLALLSQRGFTAEELGKFLKDSYSILGRAIEDKQN